MEGILAHRSSADLLVVRYGWFSHIEVPPLTIQRLHNMSTTSSAFLDESSVSFKCDAQAVLRPSPQSFLLSTLQLKL